MKASWFLILMALGCAGDRPLEPRATRVGECDNVAACGVGVEACALDRDLVRSLCFPLDDGSCPVIGAGTEVCSDSCCVVFTCVRDGDLCVPTVTDKR